MSGEQIIKIYSVIKAKDFDKSRHYYFLNEKEASIRNTRLSITELQLETWQKGMRMLVL